MNVINLDMDEAGHYVILDQQRRTIRINCLLPETVLASFVGEPLSRHFKGDGPYDQFASSTITSATNNDGWVEVRFD